MSGKRKIPKSAHKLIRADVKKGEKQEVVARRWGLSQQHVSRIVRGVQR